MASYSWGSMTETIDPQTHHLYTVSAAKTVHKMAWSLRIVRKETWFLCEIL